jgi:hypothetical protein
MTGASALEAALWLAMAAAAIRLACELADRIIFRIKRRKHGRAKKNR